jgi:methylenetetrahydrofolate reductase (NADPH)
MTQPTIDVARFKRPVRKIPMSVSVDVSSSDVRRTAGLAVTLPAALETFVPWLPNTTPEVIILATESLRRSGLTPIPHVAARRLGSAAEARRLLAELRVRSGVETVLLIGGDVARPAGPYESSLELLRSGALQAAGIRSVGFAGYPEGRPGIALETLWQSLHDKLDYARTSGLETFIVSQFCFDGAVIAAWIKGLRARGIAVPVRVGVAGPAKLRKLLLVGLRCGVGSSLRALSGRIGSVARLVATHGPDDVLHDVAAAIGGTIHLDRISLHVFAFGGIDLTARWLAEFRDEHFLPNKGAIHV